MSILTNALWGGGFLLCAVVLVLLMYRAWSYPYDKNTNRSSAPRSLVWSHRLLGYVYVAIYIFLMIQMVPRLWTYQVELPARTVAHLGLGLTIGALLFTKLVIVRFFKHMEAKLVPALGTALFICTFVLVLLALPVTLREAFLRDLATQGDVFSEDRIERIKAQLPKTGLTDETLLTALATSDGLLAGRKVLTAKCVQCHDLRTILARPRTPENWRKTVERMASRSTVLHPISEEEQWQVTAYLLAISPTLQRSLMQKRESDAAVDKSREAVADAMQRSQQPPGEGEFDTAAAEEAFQQTCSQCHAYQLVDARPPANASDAAMLVSRMVRNGLAADDEVLETIIRYLTQKYAADTTPAAADVPAAENAEQDVSARADDSEAGLMELVVRPFADELRFETHDITAKTGGRVRLLLHNTASGGLTHNFILLNDPAAYDDVQAAAFAAADTGYAPEHPAIVASIPAVSSGGQSSVTFNVPQVGEYTFFCMMPGHGATMRGTLTVTP